MSTRIAISDLDKKVIKSLKAQLASGYKHDDSGVEAIIQAVRLGKIRITRERDLINMYDLKGDAFNPEVNPDIPADQLKREERSFEARIRRSGAWVMISEYWTGRYWERHGDMMDNIIGGFVGHDFFGSGYELQVMQSALDGYNSQ